MPQLPKGSVPLPDGVAEKRAEIFERLREHLGAEGHDQSTPGADPHGRFAVLTESVRGFGRSLTRCSSVDRASVVGAANMGEGWMPSLCYDLDTLDGDEPDIEVGDIVEMIDGEETFEVAMVDYDRDRVIDSNTKWARMTEVRIIERAEPDERLPVSHRVAKAQTIVVYNTVAG